MSNLINLQNLKSVGKYQIPVSLFFLPGQGMGKEFTCHFFSKIILIE